MHLPPAELAQIDQEIASTTQLVAELVTIASEDVRKKGVPRALIELADHALIHIDEDQKDRALALALIQLARRG